MALTIVKNTKNFPIFWKNQQHGQNSVISIIIYAKQKYTHTPNITITHPYTQHTTSPRTNKKSITNATTNTKTTNSIQIQTPPPKSQHHIDKRRDHHPTYHEAHSGAQADGSRWQFHGWPSTSRTASESTARLVTTHDLLLPTRAVPTDPLLPFVSPKSSCRPCARTDAEAGRNF